MNIFFHSLIMAGSIYLIFVIGIYYIENDKKFFVKYSDSIILLSTLCALFTLPALITDNYIHSSDPELMLILIYITLSSCLTFSLIINKTRSYEEVYYMPGTEFSFSLSYEDFSIEQVCSLYSCKKLKLGSTFINDLFVGDEKKCSAELKVTRFSKNTFHAKATLLRK